MNLKSFHLVFIACASALAFLFCAWVVTNPSLTGLPRLAGSLGAFAVGAALIGYEAWFLRYSKRAR
jgi:hypothetical protein